MKFRGTVSNISTNVFQKYLSAKTIVSEDEINRIFLLCELDF